MFTQNTIDKIKEISIYDVVVDHVALKPTSTGYKGLCPFHAEKSASFMLNLDKNIYKCFGCGAAGDSISFVQNHLSLSFREAVEFLANKHGIELETQTDQSQKEYRQKNQTKKENDRLYEVLATAEIFYSYILSRPVAETARQYLRERQIEESTIKYFSLGYAPPGWDNLFKYLTEYKRFPAEDLVNAGLIKQRSDGSGFYDIFRDRLMIPLRDLQGRVIGFNSRRLTESQEQGPKYLHSPDTPLFHKSKFLYNLNNSYAKFRENNKALVVEGAFDVFSLYQIGLSSVASLGTSISEEQGVLLAKYTKNLILNFDADKAGQVAVERAIFTLDKLIFTGSIDLKIIQLPSGKDVDEFLKSPKGDEFYKIWFNNPKPFISWLIEGIVEKANLDDPGDFKSAITDCKTILGKIQDPDILDYYVQFCANLLAQDNKQLIPMYLRKLLPEYLPAKPVVKATTAQPSKKTETAIATKIKEKDYGLEEIIISLYILYPEYREMIVYSLDGYEYTWTHKELQSLWANIKQVEEVDYSRDIELIYKYQDLSCKIPLKEISHEEAGEAFDMLSLALERASITRKINHLLMEIRQVDPDDFHTINQISKDLQHLTISLENTKA